jgi:type I restriction enzyme S subunit
MRRGTVDSTAIQFVPVDVFPKIQQYRIFSTDLYISVAGTLGLVGQIPSALDGANLTENANRISAIRFSKSYLYQVLASPLVQSVIESERTVGAQPKLALGRIRNFNIPLPPTREEQFAIGGALTDADGLIDSLEQLLTKKRQIKQGAMQELLTGKRRRPGFAKAWSCKEVRDLVRTPVTDGPHTTPVFVESGVPFLSVNNLVGNRIDFTDLRFITKEDDQLFARKCKPQRGDVLLGKAASVGKVAIVEDDLDFNIWSPIALIRTVEELDSRFLYYQLQSRSVTTQISVLTNSSSQGNLGMGDIERLQIAYPCVHEQREIAEVLSDVDAEIAALEARLTKARALKQAMAQALLTGRIRLVEPTP